MAIEQANISVTNAAKQRVTTLVESPQNDIPPHTVVIQNPVGSAGSVLIGDASLDATHYGYELVAGQAITLDVGRNEIVYVLASGTTVGINIMRLSVG